MNGSIPARRVARSRERLGVLLLAAFTAVLLVAFLFLEVSDLLWTAGGI